MLQVSGKEFYSARISQPCLLGFFCFLVYYILRDSFSSLLFPFWVLQFFCVSWVVVLISFGLDLDLVFVFVSFCFV